MMAKMYVEPMISKEHRKYSLIRHAAHYGPGAGGHDLEHWDIQAPKRLSHTEFDLPGGAEYHSGYVDAEGNQHWVYVRTASFSEAKCPRCPQ